MLNSLEMRVRKTILKHGMFAGGEHVLVGVSGGADSTALLLCLHSLAFEFRLRITVAHLNHMIRGTEADADEEFVRILSARLGLPFISEKIDVKRQAESEKENLEESARRTRYEFLRRAADRAAATRIAVGHNLNDQAETALFRLVRGSGIEGLSSIYPVVDNILIRPMIECSREAILSYLAGKDTGFREDSTNKDLSHSRNRIRRELIPYLEKHLNPQLIPALAREAAMARETWSFVQSEAARISEKICSKSDQGISLRVKDLLQLHPALRKQVLRQALKEYLGSLRGIVSTHIESILSLSGAARSGSQIQLPHGHIAARQFDLIIFKQALPPTPAFSYEFKIPGECHVAEAQAVFISEIRRAPDLQAIIEDCSSRAFLETSALPERLTVRSRVPGDRYGGPGHRKVKKMLIDGKIPMTERPLLPMVAAGTDVIWIPGFRSARNYEARPGSPACLMIQMTKEPVR